MDKATVLGNLNPDGVRLDISGANFRSRVFTVGELLDMLNDGKLDFIGGRPFSNWTPPRRARVVETLILGLPPTSIILDGASGVWHVVEGAECLKAYLDFYSDKLAIKDSVILADKTDSLTFNILPPRLKERFLNTPVIGCILTSDCSFYDRLWVYASALKKQNIKHTTLWECALFIRPDISEALNSFAETIGVTNTRILWIILLGIALSERLPNAFFRLGKTSKTNEMLKKMPFDIFECVSLPAIIKINERAKLGEDEKMLHNALVSTLSSFKSDNTTNRLSDQEICLGLALGYFCSSKETPSIQGLTHFLEIWNDYKPLRKKTVEKYIERASEIIKIMSDDTHD